MVPYDVLLSYPNKTQPNYISIVDPDGNEVLYSQKFIPACFWLPQYKYTCTVAVSSLVTSWWDTFQRGNILPENFSVLGEITQLPCVWHILSTALLLFFNTKLQDSFFQVQGSFIALLWNQLPCIKVIQHTNKQRDTRTRVRVYIQVKTD